jgi:hypothetical protein
VEDQQNPGQSHTSSTLFAAVGLEAKYHYFGYISEVVVVRDDTVYKSVVIFKIGLLSGS